MVVILCGNRLQELRKFLSKLDSLDNQLLIAEYVFNLPGGNLEAVLKGLQSVSQKRLNRHAVVDVEGLQAQSWVK